MSEATLINPQSQNKTEHLIEIGTVIAGKYMVTEKLNSTAGESQLYICEYDGKKYAAKIYNRDRTEANELMKRLNKTDLPYISKPYEWGGYDGRYYEIYDYYPKGSLKGKTFTAEELLENIIPSLNEALHTLHKTNIIHRDIKPSNITLRDNGKDIVLIDFGISSVRNNDSTVLVSESGMTPEYSAPETFKGLYLEESDYYSLGITIYELFCGFTPYNGMNSEEIEKYIVMQKIPFPDDMPDALKNLITALTYSDISGRNDSRNPNRRWTYKEVKKWCEGEEQVIPGTVVDTKFRFAGKSYEDLSEFGAELLEKLQTEQNEDISFYETVFSEHRLSEYAKIIYCGEKEKYNAVSDLEALYEANKDNKHNKAVVFFVAGFVLSGTRQLRIKDKSFSDINELSAFLQKQLDTNEREFGNWCKNITNGKGELNPQVEAWLTVLGKKKEIEKWKENTKNERT